MKFRLALSAMFLTILAAGCSTTQKPETTAAPVLTAPPAMPATGPVAPPTTDEEIIKSAMSAAPSSIAKEATIIAMNDKMEVRTVRQGTNGWTCIPDMPSPGVDPMCLDKNGLEWAQAWMSHKTPSSNKMGFGYMLAGGSDASNDDPFATKPKEGEPWVDTGPHVMILSIGDRFDGYPATHDDTSKPYVMWSKTPYAHLMIPVK